MTTRHLAQIAVTVGLVLASVGVEAAGPEGPGVLAVRVSQVRGLPPGGAKAELDPSQIALIAQAGGTSVEVPLPLFYDVEFGPTPCESPGVSNLESCEGDVAVPAAAAVSVGVAKLPAGVAGGAVGDCAPGRAAGLGAGERRECQVLVGYPRAAEGGGAVVHLITTPDDTRDAVGPDGELAIGAVKLRLSDLLARDGSGGCPGERCEGLIGLEPGTHSVQVSTLPPGWTSVLSGDCATGQIMLTAGEAGRCGLRLIQAEAYWLARLSVADRAVTEGSSGTTTALVRVTADVPPFVDASVAYATANGTAVAPSDYTHTSGVLSFPAGASERTIPIPIVADTLGEPNETFTLALSSPVNATLGKASATITILNDDDTTPPVIAAKRDVIAESKAAPVAVLYSNPTATDNLDGAVAVSCLPASGTLFPFGTTKIQCTARDRNGNTGASVFSVIVRLPTTPGAVTNPGNLDAPLARVAPGQRVRVTAGGFKPGNTVLLRFVTASGGPIDLGPTTAAADGRIDARPKIPKGIAAGSGQMTAVGIGPDGSEFVRGWLLTVTAED